MNLYTDALNDARISLIKLRSGAKKRGPQAMEVSRGELNTKSHALCDALGHLLRLKLTEGNRSDTGELLDLVEGVACSKLLADKAYDNNEIVKALKTRGIDVVINPKINKRFKRKFNSIPITWTAWDRENVPKNESFPSNTNALGNLM